MATRPEKTAEELAKVEEQVKDAEAKPTPPVSPATTDFEEMVLRVVRGGVPREVRLTVANGRPEVTWSDNFSSVEEVMGTIRRKWMTQGSQQLPNGQVVQISLQDALINMIEEQLARELAAGTRELAAGMRAAPRRKR